MIWQILTLALLLHAFSHCHELSDRCCESVPYVCFVTLKKDFMSTDRKIKSRAYINYFRGYISVVPSRCPL